MTEHETKVKVNMSFFVDVATESHPECIDEETMKEIIAANAIDYLAQLTEDDLGVLIDGFDFTDVKMFDNGKEI